MTIYFDMYQTYFRLNNNEDRLWLIAAVKFDKILFAKFCKEPTPALVARFIEIMQIEVTRVVCGLHHPRPWFDALTNAAQKKQIKLEPMIFESFYGNVRKACAAFNADFKLKSCSTVIDANKQLEQFIRGRGEMLPLPL